MERTDKHVGQVGMPSRETIAVTTLNKSSHGDSIALMRHHAECLNDDVEDTEDTKVMLQRLKMHVP